MSSGEFFQRQRQTRRQSHRLLILFVLSLVGMALLANLLAGLVSFLANKGGTDWFVSDHALLLTAIIFFMVGLGSLFRYLEVRHGGATLARHYGAVPMPERGRSRQLEMLVDVAEEMAIASRQKMPALFIMPLERGINAFVAGNKADDLVLVVTQGALDNLDRAELQAVVAHEFGHIDNDDVPLNMRLLIVLGGLLAVDQVGRIITGPDASDRFLPLAIVGVVLRILGSVGVICAGLVRAAFGRQREYLADACAVQFTRQSDGLASALSKVGNHHFGSRLSGYYADELAHLCFLKTIDYRRFSSLFSVHPAIAERVRRIDPFYCRRQQKREQASEANKPSVSSNLGLDAVSIESGNNFQNSILQINATGLPDNLLVMLSDTLACESVLYSLLAINFTGKPALFYKALELNGKKSAAQSAFKLQSSNADKLTRFSTELIFFAGKELQIKMSKQKRQEIFKNLQKISSLDGGHNFQEFVLLVLIADALDIEMQHDSKASPPTLPQAYGLMLSLITETAGHANDRQRSRYQQLLKIYGADEIPPRSAEELTIVADLQAALSVLNEQMKAMREAFVTHAAEIILDDAHITQAEKNLLYLLCAVLGVARPKLH